MTSTKRKLYVSHSLAAWNSRMFEFGAVLFLSTIYPNTLLPASVYALARSLAAVLLSTWLGKIVDTKSRISVVRISIVGQRVSVIVSCGLIYLLDRLRGPAGLTPWLLLAILSLLACVEKLSATMNTIAIERDWVVVVAAGSTEDLRAMNSTMRRIDLTCKLVAPLLIAFIHGWSPKIGYLATFAIALLSVPTEYLLIARVHRACPALQRLPPSTTGSSGSPSSSKLLSHLSSWLSTALSSTTSDLHYYTTHRAFLPSVSLALLYLTVLSFGGQMINYLVSRTLASLTIGLLRTTSALFEISATFIAPLLMSRIGPVRSGIWLLNWQLFCLAIATATMWVQDLAIGGLWLFLPAVMLSRAGLWGFDLSAQVLIQEEVEAEGRGRFSAIEAGFQNLFEMLAFATTIIWARPEEFKVPALISAGSTAGAAVLYALYVRRERGHLFHRSKCFDKRGGGQGYNRLGRGDYELSEA
ncbi:Ferroporti-1 [Elsinoe ampelina]|uniref:Solute carrier family 40 member n=1 Tax=Elsinoe ampelina TaxID=302913 RepID=A0A6A6GCP7_9PEZI|nr:Ferroporti-1 [Elsinoe ampelina]